MNFYQTAVETLKAHELVQGWPELAGVLDRAALRAPIAWKLPVVACQAVGGAGQEALPAVSAFTCVHISILLVDDLLDEDPRGEHMHIGAGRAANLAVALNALSTAFLLDTYDGPQAAQVSRALNTMQVALSRGQDLDVQNLGTEEAYWEIAHGKSGVYFATALYLGALCGGANKALANQTYRFGEVYGEMMQIHDDLNDCMEEAPGPDWQQGRYSLPILFASIVGHPDRERFRQLCENIDKPGALKEAQSILVRCGAISYSVNEILKRHAAAKELLDAMPLAKRGEFDKLLREVIEPVENLFATVGAEPLKDLA
jgi:geranylgeranyl pyrophosphate synthase